MNALRIIALLLSLGLLMSTKCKKEIIVGSQYFHIVNNSEKDIVVAPLGRSSYDNRCALYGFCVDKVRANSSDSCYQRYGWGSVMGDYMEFCVIDLNYEHAGFAKSFPCDSLEFKNRILKIYKYNVDSFNKYNYTITYP